MGAGSERGWAQVAAQVPIPQRVDTRGFAGVTYCRDADEEVRAEVQIVRKAVDRHRRNHAGAV